MELKWIRNFLEVARLENVTRAAHRLNISQPALTRQLAQLEAALGVKLVEKSGRRIVLTESGAVAFRYAERLVGTANRLEQEARTHDAAPTGTVAIAAPPSISQVLFQPLVRRSRANFPDIRLRLLESQSSLLPWLANGTIDLAILSDTVVTEGFELTMEPLAREELYLVYPEHFEQFGPECSIQDVASLPFAFPTGHSHPRTLVEDQARLAGHEPNIVVEAEALPFLVDLVREEIACTILPFSGVSKEVARGGIGISRLSGHSIMRVLAYSADLPLSAAAQELAQMIREEFYTLYQNNALGIAAKIAITRKPHPLNNR